MADALTLFATIVPAAVGGAHLYGGDKTTGVILLVLSAVFGWFS